MTEQTQQMDKATKSELRKTATGPFVVFSRHPLTVVAQFAERGAAEAYVAAEVRLSGFGRGLVAESIA